MKQFSTTFAEAVVAVRMADPSLTNLETIHELAWQKAKSEARTMSDPSTSPTPIAPEKQQEYDALQSTLDDASILQARRTAILSKPKEPVPELNFHYRAAIELISRSPDMTEAACKALVKAAREKDSSELQARVTATSNPQPSNAWQAAK